MSSAQKFLKNTAQLKVALVSDWLTNFGGAEKVLLEFHRLFPKAPIFTTLYNEKVMKAFSDAHIRTSFLQKIPGAKSRHQIFLRWMPYVFENFDFSDFDIVISSNHACSKGIITKPQTLHICYCHSPMRYVWDEWQDYIARYRFPRFIENFIKFSLHKLRVWDRVAADRVDVFLANSFFIKKRIFKYYRRDAEVLHPPVDIDRFYLSDQIDDYFLAVGRLVPYKRFDLLIETFNRLKLPLKICGSGPDFHFLRKKAEPNIEFLGTVSDKNLSDLYAHCRAFIFPQCEDFGIAPLEAMASGRPVIAYAAGGALETVIDGQTGVFFHEQTISDISTAVERLNQCSFDPEFIRNHAEKFSSVRFRNELKQYIETFWQQK